MPARLTRFGIDRNSTILIIAWRVIVLSKLLLLQRKYFFPHDCFAWWLFSQEIDWVLWLWTSLVPIINQILPAYANLVIRVLLRMVALGAGFCGVNLYDMTPFMKIMSKSRWSHKKKKKSSPKIEWVFSGKVKTKKRFTLEIECVFGPNKWWGPNKVTKWWLSPPLAMPLHVITLD